MAYVAYVVRPCHKRHKRHKRMWRKKVAAEGRERLIFGQRHKRHIKKEKKIKLAY